MEGEAKDLVPLYELVVIHGMSVKAALLKLVGTSKETGEDVYYNMDEKMANTLVKDLKDLLQPVD